METTNISIIKSDVNKIITGKGFLFYQDLANKPKEENYFEIKNRHYILKKDIVILQNKIEELYNNREANIDTKQGILIDLITLCIELDTVSLLTYINRFIDIKFIKDTLFYIQDFTNFKQKFISERGSDYYSLIDNEYIKEYFVAGKYTKDEANKIYNILNKISKYSNDIEIEKLKNILKEAVPMYNKIISNDSNITVDKPILINTIEEFKELLLDILKQSNIYNSEEIFNNFAKLYNTLIENEIDLGSLEVKENTVYFNNILLLTKPNLTKEELKKLEEERQFRIDMELEVEEISMFSDTILSANLSYPINKIINEVFDYRIQKYNNVVKDNSTLIAQSNQDKIDVIKNKFVESMDILDKFTLINLKENMIFNYFLTKMKPYKTGGKDYINNLKLHNLFHYNQLSSIILTLIIDNKFKSFGILKEYFIDIDEVKNNKDIYKIVYKYLIKRYAKANENKIINVSYNYMNIENNELYFYKDFLFLEEENYNIINTKEEELELNKLQLDIQNSKKNPKENRFLFIDIDTNYSEDGLEILKNNIVSFINSSGILSKEMFEYNKNSNIFRSDFVKIIVNNKLKSIHIILLNEATLIDENGNNKIINLKRNRDFKATFIVESFIENFKESIII